MDHSKGLKSVMMCVLILGLVLEHVQVEGKVYCPDSSREKCYRDYCARYQDGPIKRECARVCGCDPDDPDVSNSGDEPVAIKYCKLGCRSSLCDTMNNGVFVVGEEMMKINAERCSDECDRFCNRNARMAASSVDA